MLNRGKHIKILQRGDYNTQRQDNAHIQYRTKHTIHELGDSGRHPIRTERWLEHWRSTLSPAKGVSRRTAPLQRC